MKKVFSPWTFIGILLGVTIFCAAVVLSTKNYRMFFDYHSFLLVFGGTIAATMISYHARYVTKALMSLVTIIFPVHISPKSLVRDVLQIIEWANVSKTQGMKAFETTVKTGPLKDSFVRYCSEMVLAGYKGSELRQMLSDAIETKFERSMVQSNILHTMAGFAPAFGMVGTLIGLVITLEKVGGDFSEIGKGMALAFLATLYGVILAQLVFKPGAEKVQQTMEMIRYRNVLVMEGFLMLTEGKSAFEIQDRLNSFLDDEFHIDLAKEKL